jgi:O-antigen/teichoic acid export membrane protein
MASLKKNLVANYVGQGWRALMALLFIPLYIRYLGIEAYGLIGIFAMLQAWLSFLDMGMRPALAREMARFTSGAHNAQSIRDLLRSIELIGIAIAAVTALAICAASGWLASHWLTTKHLPPEVVAQAFAVMGIVIGLRFIEDIYVSGIAGLQRQVLQNVVIGAAASARGLGVVGVLAWVSPTVKAFFLWQGLISLLTVAALGGLVYHALPPSPMRPRFSGRALTGIWRFAAGMMGIAFLSLLLTQVDKILLSRLLTLESFAHYALASAVANGLYLLTGPIAVALYPRFTQLVTTGHEAALGALYHEGAQLVTVLMGAATIFLMTSGERVVRLWTGNPLLAQKVAPLLAIIALGTFFNGLMWIPYQLMLAHGWTSLAIKANWVAVCLLVPSIFWVVPSYGAIGAARVWVTLNAGYLMFVIPLMHRRLLLPADKWRWYAADVAIPFAAASASALLCQWATPYGLGRVGAACALPITAACVLATAALSAPLVRRRIARYLGGNIGKLRSPNPSAQRLARDSATPVPALGAHDEPPCPEEGAR